MKTKAVVAMRKLVKAQWNSARGKSSIRVSCLTPADLHWLSDEHAAMSNDRRPTRPHAPLLVTLS